MRKIISIALLLLTIVILTSCQLVVKENEVNTTEIDNPQIVGYRIVLVNSDVFTKELSDGDYNIDSDTIITSPFFTTNQHVITTTKNSYEEVYDVNYYIPLEGCYKLETVIKHSDNSLTYEGSIAVATSPYAQTTITNTHTSTVDEQTSSVSFTVHLITIIPLTQYKIIQYDDNYNKLKEETIDLSAATNTHYAISLDKNTNYFVMEKTFMDENEKPYLQKSVYGVEDLMNGNTMTHNEISLDENNSRVYYLFDFSLAN